MSPIIMPQGDTNMPKPSTPVRSVKAKAMPGTKELNLDELQAVLTIAHREDYSPRSQIKILSNFKSGIKEITITDNPEHPRADGNG